jgi:hypothetical protein
MRVLEEIRISHSASRLALVFIGICFGLTHQIPFLLNAPERYKNPSTVNSEGKKVHRIGLACLLSGLG